MHSLQNTIEITNKLWIQHVNIKTAKKITSTKAKKTLVSQQCT